MGKQTIGLALGGGGARGGAHIGALQVLHNNNIYPTMIAGTSAGATIGAMYAASLDPDWMKNRFKELISGGKIAALRDMQVAGERESSSIWGQVAQFFKDRIEIVLAMNKLALMDSNNIREIIEFLLPVKTFEELQIPMIITATDVQTGQAVLHDSGDLVEAVVQSSTVPGIFTPAIKDDMYLVDGGAIMPLPVPALKGKVDYILAIDISITELNKLDRYNMYSIITRAETIRGMHYTRTLADLADFVIHPDVGYTHWSRFDLFDQLIDTGRQAAEQQIDLLKIDLSRRKGWVYKFKQWVGQMG